MATECAICYVSDLNFLLPTLVSIAGLRRFVHADKADVFLFTVDVKTDGVQGLDAVLKSHSIKLIPLDSAAFSGFDPEKFNRTHVSFAALGRFFMGDLLPASSRRIVYIDGDTWIKRDPTPLIDIEVSEGYLAASEDIISFRASCLTAHGRGVQKYFKGLGLDRQNGYFNSGVFAASRATWRTIAAEAYAFFVKNTVACKFHDQSALNAVVGDRRLRLSTKWNFQTPYRYLNVEQRINPAIYHFTQSPKPWMGKCEPWSDLYEDYQAALAPFAGLKLPLRTLDQASIDAHNAAARKKFALLKLPLMGKLLSASLGYDAFEKKTWF